MSSSSSTPLSDVALAQLLRAHGLRATAQRRAIYGLFAGTENGHLSAEEVFQQAREELPELSRATVYNALGELAEAGLLGVVEGPGPRQFDANVAPHHHFRCGRCGALYDIEPEHIELALRDPGYEVERAHVLLEGLCPKCAGVGSDVAPPRPRPVVS
ncbi:MAG TPA: transcriptional repressor [Solirubrobacteraceae bacterium]|nr:transcriptional repressor [Solirubrobacteraceae bacterium]